MSNLCWLDSDQMARLRQYFCTFINAMVRGRGLIKLKTGTTSPSTHCAAKPNYSLSCIFTKAAAAVKIFRRRAERNAHTIKE